MSRDELVNAALVAIWPEVREPKRTKEIYGFRRSRYADMTLITAATMILADERHGERAKALHTEALSRAGIKPTQFARLAPWAQERVAQAIQNMLVITRPKPEKDRPPRIPQTTWNGIDAEAAIEHDGIICLIDGVKSRMLHRHIHVTHKIKPEDYITRFGLRPDYPMTAPKYARPEATASPQKARRGRPPKTGSAMSGAERQRLLQQRRRDAEETVRRARELVREAHRGIPDSDDRTASLLEKLGDLATLLDVDIFVTDEK